MRDIYYEFMELDSDESFHLLGKSLGGVLSNKSLCFDNNIAKGEIVKSSPDEGLWIRKWKLTVSKRYRCTSCRLLPEKKKNLFLFIF